MTVPLMPRPLLPMKLLERLQEMLASRMAGQLIVNLNDGHVSSFEVKEHYRIPS